jgi:hypothetical protein
VIETIEEFEAAIKEWWGTRNDVNHPGLKAGA